jgi:hypothetical protein
MLEGFSLGNYPLLFDYTGRPFREGKAAIASGVDEILERLGTSVDRWQVRLETLRTGRWFGRVIRLESRASACGGRAEGSAPGAESGGLPGDLSC